MYTRCKTITITKSVKYIGDYNFYFTGYIQDVFFEGNPEYIAPTVFNFERNQSSSKKITIYGPSGGTVEEFAKINNEKFEVWNPATNK